MSAQESWEIPDTTPHATKPAEVLELVPDLEIVEALGGQTIEAAKRDAHQGRQGSDEDNIDVYMRGFSRYPLLSHEEEIALGTLIQTGIAAKEQLDELSGVTTTLDADLLHTLEEQVAAGSVAEHDMIVSNLRLVVWEAKRWVNKGLGLRLDDLTQAGNKGLIVAARKYLPEIGTRFNTYAVPWIRQFIQREIDNTDRTIRFPVAAEEVRRSHRRFHDDWEEQYGEQAGEDDFKEHASDSMTENDYELAMAIESTQPGSLDEPLDETSRDSTTRGDHIAGNDAGDSYRNDLRAKGIINEIRDVLAACDVSDFVRSVYSLRYGVYLPWLEGETITHNGHEVVYTKGLVVEGGVQAGDVGALFGMKKAAIDPHMTKLRRTMKEEYEARGGSAFL